MQRVKECLTFNRIPQLCSNVTVFLQTLLENLPFREPSWRSDDRNMLELTSYLSQTTLWN